MTDATTHLAGGLEGDRDATARRTLIFLIGLLGVVSVASLAQGASGTSLWAALGASFLVLADLISRMIVAPAELPIGIVTAMVGGPVFLWLLLRLRGIVDP